MLLYLRIRTDGNDSLMVGVFVSSWIDRRQTAGWISLMKTKLTIAGFAVLHGIAFVSAANSQTAYPMLMSLRPVAVQAGQTAEVEVKSRYSMLGAYQVLVGGSGVTGEVVPPQMKQDAKQDDSAKKPTLEKLKVKFTAAADALCGRARYSPGDSAGREHGRAARRGPRSGARRERQQQYVNEARNKNHSVDIVAGDYMPRSAVDIWPKDLGIVLDIARAAKFSAPLTATALQQFLAASGSGLGREDDAAVAKVYARNAGLIAAEKGDETMTTLMGAIADDFTGGSDLASTLARGGGADPPLRRDAGGGGRRGGRPAWSR